MPDSVSELSLPEDQISPQDTAADSSGTSDGEDDTAKRRSGNEIPGSTSSPRPREKISKRADRGIFFYTLGSIAIVVATLYFAQSVLIPLALAILFAFLLTPFVTRAERWGLNRVAATMVVVL